MTRSISKLPETSLRPDSVGTAEINDEYESRASSPQAPIHHSKRWTEKDERWGATKKGHKLFYKTRHTTEKEQNAIHRYCKMKWQRWKEKEHLKMSFLEEEKNHNKIEIFTFWNPHRPILSIAASHKSTPCNHRVMFFMMLLDSHSLSVWEEKKIIRLRRHFSFPVPNFYMGLILPCFYCQLLCAEEEQWWCWQFCFPVSCGNRSRIRFIWQWHLQVWRSAQHTPNL